MTDPTGAGGSPNEPALERVLRQQEEVVLREIADETLLIPIRGKLAQLQQIYVLSPVGAFIWHQLDGKRDLEEVRDNLLENFEVSVEEAQADLTSYVEELLEVGLIVEATGSTR